MRFQRAADRIQLHVVAGEERDHAISDVLVDVAAKFLDLGCLQAQARVEHFHRLLRRPRLSHRCKPAHVGKENRQDDLLSSGDLLRHRRLNHLHSRQRDELLHVGAFA